MKIVYAVSVNTHAMSMLRTQRPKNLLLSYAYANALGQVPYEPDLLMLDSGAFSAWNAERPTDLFGYGRFAEQICGARRNKPSYVINLDVIPGKVGKTSSEDERRTGMAESLRNADVLRERYSLPIAEVFHQDEPWEYLDKLVSRMPKDGLLCLSPRNDVSVTERARWCWSVTDYWRGKLGDIRRFPRCHGLAVTARECLTVFPFYTVDSSTWFVAFRFGRKIRADGAQIDFTSVTSLPSSRVLPAQKLVVAQSMANLEQLERFGTELWARRGLKLVQSFVWLLTGVSGTMASPNGRRSSHVSVVSVGRRVAASALAVAKPVYTTSAGKVALCNATELSVRKAFAGLTVTSAAADGDSVDVAYSGQTSTGHSGLSVGKAYWLCGANVVSETDLQAWIDAQASDTPYRQLGTAVSATELQLLVGDVQTT